MPIMCRSFDTDGSGREGDGRDRCRLFLFRLRLPRTRFSRASMQVSIWSVCITEGIPVNDMVKVKARHAWLKDTPGWTKLSRCCDTG